MNEVPQDIRFGDLNAAVQLQIADLTLDLRQEELRDATGARIDLRNRSFSVLRHLATNAGRVVSKNELLAANWPGVTVTEDSLKLAPVNLQPIRSTRRNFAPAQSMFAKSHD